MSPQFVAKGTDADEADAIIAAAALRYFAQQTTKTMFDLPDPIRLIARQEGWIFGVEPVYAELIAVSCFFREKFFLPALVPIQSGWRLDYKSPHLAFRAEDFI